MRIFARKLGKIALGIAVILISSCGHIEQPLLEHQKCVGDGANLYVRCSDGRQKVFDLGYGTLYVMKDSTVAEATEFCGENPEHMDVTFRNAHYLFKVESTGNVVITVPGSVDKTCKEARGYANLRDVRRAKIKAVPSSDPPPLDP